MQYNRLGGTPQWLKDVWGTIDRVAPVAGGFVGAATGTAALTNFSAAMMGPEVSAGYSQLYGQQVGAELTKQQLDQKFQLQQQQFSLLSNRRSSSSWDGDGSSGDPPGSSSIGGLDTGTMIAIGGGLILVLAIASRRR